MALELKPDQTDLFADSVDNSCVKLINAWSPFRLLGEYLALEMYDFLQIPTPAHALTFVRFNGVDFGLYLAAEDVNADFLKKNDPDGGGTLFKANATDINTAYDGSGWFSFPQVAEDRGFKRADALIEALDRGAGYEEYLDVDEILRYFACLAVWGADSTILTGANNFFLYDNGERFILIPWDSSEAFEAYNSGNGIDRFRREGQIGDFGPPLFSLLMENEAYKRAYHDYIRQINDSFLAPEVLDARFNALAAAADPYLERDCTMLCNRPYEIPVAPAVEYGTVNSLLETLHGIHENLSSQLSGKTDVFYVNPLFQDSDDDEEEEEEDDGDELGISLLIPYSPRLDPEITEKICAAYPAWRRAQGQIPFDADDPAEIAVAAAVFLSVFLLLLLLTHKKHRKNH